jgi:lipid A 4'-phosphatase
MNRTGLVAALAIAAIVGVVFGVYPQLDLDISLLFFDPASHKFNFGQHGWVLWARDAAYWSIAALAILCVCALLGKLILPSRRMLVPGRAAVFLLVTLALGPGILANTILKDHWGRARPIDVIQIGSDPFTPWWDFRAACRDNCSFIAGEPSGAFWTLAPAALAPPQWRVLAYCGALAFGTAIGVLRIAAGGHFFTDVVFAGVFMYLLIWTVHGLMFRWQATRITDAAIERPLASTGQAMRNAAAALARRFRGNPGKPS